MNRRDLIKSAAAVAITAKTLPTLARMGRGGVSNAVNIVGINLAAGGAANYYYEDLPLFQDIIPWSKGWQTVSSPGNIGATWTTNDANGWPTTDWGVYLHHSSLNPSWTTGPFYCGFISRGAGTEVITGVGATISSIDRTAAPLVTFQLTPTTTTWGFTVTSTSGGTTGMYAYPSEYSASASQGHIDITPANVLAGKPIFTTEALSVFGAFNRFRTIWGQNAWYRVGGIIVQLAATALAGSTSATLVANSLQIGTYLMVFRPSTTQSTWDVHSVTITSVGQTAISWTDGALNFDATAVGLPHSSTTRSTPTNVKANNGWGQTFSVGTDGYPLLWYLALSVKTGKQLWSHIPIHDDGTYYQAHFQDIHDFGPVGVDQYIEFDNELWNDVGEVGQVMNGLAVQAGLTSAQYLATRIHTVANYGRTLFGGDWNTRIRLVFAWQMGISAFINQVLQYMLAQGWSPAADLWCLSTAPYIVGYPAITGTDTTAQVLAKVQTAVTFPTAQLGPTQTNCHVEKSIAMALWYGLPGVYECYEWGWDSVTDFNTSANPNIGAAIMDPGMTAIQNSYGQWSLDMGIKGFNDFEGGCSSDTTSQSPRYEFSNDYATLVTTGSPRLNGLRDTMNGVFTPTRNVIQNSGDWIDARNYLDSNSTLNPSYPTFTTISNVSPINNYNLGWKIQCPKAVTLQLQVYFTTTAARTMNAYLDGVQVATNVAVPSGLTWTGTPAGSSAPVVFATLTLSKGVHYIELGNIASIASVTANALQFQ